MSLAGLEHGGQGDRHGCGYLLVAERQEWSWLVLLLLVYPLTQWLEQPLVQAVHGCRLSAMEAFGRTSSSTCLPCRVVRTWNLDTSPLPLYLSAYSGVWVLPVEYSVLDFSGDPASTSLGSTVDTCHSMALEEFTYFQCCGELEP